LARPDAPVFPQAAVDHLGLRLPFPDVADSHPDAESLLGAALDAVRRVCLDTADAIPERRRGRLVRMDVAVEKLAGREPRPADAVQARLALAWTAFLKIPAWVSLVESWALLRAAAALYRPDEGLSAA
jgi:hypothetical protein